MEKVKTKSWLWRDKKKPRPPYSCSSGMTFWPEKKKEEVIENDIVRAEKNIH